MLLKERHIGEVVLFAQRIRPASRKVHTVHKELKEHLRSAAGSSEFVVAVNVDIRGFSSFFSDSSQAAAYLGSMYTRILDQHFPDVSFFKPTGDGLLIVRSINKRNIEGVVRSSVESALNLRDEFADLCKGDALLNFPLPELVGMGIARGTATRIFDGDLTLDYSGYPLNLASRLMDLARPSGVVFDASLQVGLELPELLDRFTSDRVYVRGLADSLPIEIFKSTDVQVPPSNLTPFGTIPFKEKRITIPFRDLKTRGNFRHVLTHAPASESTIVVSVAWPASTAAGKKHPSMLLQVKTKFWTYDARSPRDLLIDYNHVARLLESKNCKTTWDVYIEIEYAAPMERPTIAVPPAKVPEPPTMEDEGSLRAT